MSRHGGWFLSSGDWHSPCGYYLAQHHGQGWSLLFGRGLLIERTPIGPFYQSLRDARQAAEQDARAKPAAAIEAALNEAHAREA